jgi:hypothetical protein
MCGSTILDPGISWRWVISLTPQPLYPGERDTRTHWLGDWMGPKNRFGWRGEEKILPLLRLEKRPASCPVHSQSQCFLITMKNHGSIPGRNKRWSPQHADRLWAPHQHSCRRIQRALSPSIKQLRSVTDCSPPYSAEVKNAWSSTAAPSMSP